MIHIASDTLPTRAQPLFLVHEASLFDVAELFAG